MEMPLLIVVEGKRDATVLRRLLPRKFSHARFFAAGGRSSVETVARNILVHESGAVMIVADADTNDSERAHDDRIAMQVALRNVASDGRFDVFLFVPTIEVLFFEYPAVLETLRKDISHDHLLVQHGRDLPQRSLSTLLDQRSLESWMAELSEADWEQLRKGEQAQSLLESIDSLMSKKSSAL